MGAPRDGSSPSAGGIGFVVGACASLLVFYVLLVGTPGAHEVAAGLGASLAAGLFALAAHRSAGRKLRAGPAALRAVPQVLTALARDTVRVGFLLLRAQKGGVVSQPMTASGDGERGVAILAASIAPNSFVIDSDSDAMQLHRMTGTEKPRG